MISSIHLQGFQSHLDTTLELSPGVNILVGDSDSGKSAVIRALQWLVTNRPSGDSFVNANAKTVSVEITTPTGTASRHRKPKNGYTINGETFTAVARTVPEELRSVIDLQPINFQGQLLGQYFLVLDTPGEISRYLSTIFGFEIVDLLVAGIKQAHQQVQYAITAAEEHLENVEREIATLATVETLEPLVTEVESLVTVIEQGAQYETSLASLITELKAAAARRVQLAGVSSVRLDEAERILTQLQQIEEFETGLSALLTQAKQAAAARTSARTLQTSTAAALETERAAYVESLGETCPTCFRPVDEQTRAHVLEEL